MVGLPLSSYGEDEQEAPLVCGSPPSAVPLLPDCRASQCVAGVGGGRRGPSLWQGHLEPTSWLGLKDRRVCVSKAVCLTLGRGPLAILSELGFCPCSHLCCFPQQRLGFPLKTGSVLRPQTKLYKDNIFKKGFCVVGSSICTRGLGVFPVLRGCGSECSPEPRSPPCPRSCGPGAEPPGGFSTSRLQSVHLDNRLGRVVRAPKSGCPNSTEDMGYVCKHSKGNHGKDILNDSRKSSQNQWGKDGGRWILGEGREHSST